LAGNFSKDFYKRNSEVFHGTITLIKS